jgi:alkylhydroperoxidase/carboxymuconolactone decarboxylase family protein YurZ
VTKNPLGLIQLAAQGCFDGYRTLRDTAKAAGPIPPLAKEFILIAAFTTSGCEAGVKAHVRRALDLGADAAGVTQAVLLTFGATTTMPQIGDALSWISDVISPIPDGEPQAKSIRFDAG